MDNRRRSLQEYFNAARDQAGISEQDVRDIIQRGRPGRSGRRALVLGGMLAVLLTGGGLLLRTSAGPEQAGLLHGSAARNSAPAPVDWMMEAAPTDMNPAEAAGTTTEIAPAAPANERLQISRTNTSNEQENVTMMKGRATQRILAAGMAMMGAAVTALPAQTTERLGTDVDAEVPAIVQEMQTELGTAVANYWMPRLNDYRMRIDGALSPADLDDLNRLRVRFNVLAMEWLGSAMAGEEISDEQRKQKVEELLAMYNSAKEMAERNRAGLDPVGRTVIGDLADFLPEMNQRADDFIAVRRSEIEQAGLAKKLEKARSKTSEVATLLQTGQGRMAIQMLYTAALEPLVMLYDGTDLGTLWRQVQQLSSGAGALKLPSDAITGYKLPDVMVLRPSTPNPASTTASIQYTLPEPSGQTLLRLYDAQGTLVASYNEGAKSAGDYSVQVDVSGFAPGTYLYHLTTKTPQGDRVYSRTMQVVR